jgi:hypothetical protein
MRKSVIALLAVTARCSPLHSWPLMSPLLKRAEEVEVEVVGGTAVVAVVPLWEAEVVEDWAGWWRCRYGRRTRRRNRPFVQRWRDEGWRRWRRSNVRRGCGSGRISCGTEGRLRRTDRS